MNIPDLQQPALERLLCQPSRQTMLMRVALQMGDTDADVDAAALLFQVRLDQTAMSAQIR